MSDTASSLKLAWRVGVGNYESDAAFDRLLALVREHLAIVDEVALFETITHHLYLPLEVFAERAALMGRRLRALKEAGVASAGINVLTTIGHLNEGWDYMPPLPFQPMIGHDGSVSKGCACPNTPELREYVRRKYTLVAQERPDFIWVDDDIRMHNHGVAYACFCPTCLAVLAETTGRRHTRESLVQALSSPAEGGLREAWVEQNVRSIEALLWEVAQAIREVEAGIKTGLMTAGPGWTTYSGQAFERWFPALGATKSRPGGGFYADDAPKGMVAKALEVGRQRHGLPEEVTDRQYELENFPYQVLRKAGRTFIDECTLALAAGMNGIAFNALGGGEGSFDDYLAYLAHVHEVRPAWEALVAHAEGLPTAGLWPAWTPRLMARRQVRPGEDWFGYDGRYDSTRAYLLAEIGLPLATDRAASGVILSGRLAEAFEDEELREMLSGGVLMDTATLDVLAERGLDNLAGVGIVHRVNNGVRERFTDDPLNGAYAGELRDCRIEFWGDATGLADVLEPKAAEVRILARMENYFDRQYGPCLTAHENELGGRVVVMGYAPWMFVHSAAKRAQLLNLADWITRDTLPVRVEEPVPLIPFVRLSPDRTRGAIVLLNAGFDPVPTATVRVRARPGAVRLLTAAGDQLLAPTPHPTGWSITLRDIAPWTTMCVLFG
jgi:hypothetical protein